MRVWFQRREIALNLNPLLLRIWLSRQKADNEKVNKAFFLLLAIMSKPKKSLAKKNMSCSVKIRPGIEIHRLSQKTSKRKHILEPNRGGKLIME